MIAFTIGIGEKFRSLAVESAATVRERYDCKESVILDERHLEMCPPEAKFGDFAKRVFWIKWMIPVLYQEIKRWVYHDADYRVVGEPSPQSIWMIHKDRRLIMVQDWWEDPPAKPYFNAGFFVAGRNHFGLFRWCRDNYFQTEERFGDQCVMNAGIRKLSIPVLEFPREYNAGKPGQCMHPVAKHGYW